MLLGRMHRLVLLAALGVGFANHLAVKAGGWNGTDSDAAEVPDVVVFADGFESGDTSAWAEAALALMKTADRASFGLNDEIFYTFTATNVGKAALTGVTIVDTAFSGAGSLSALDCVPPQPASMAPGSVLVCTASYTAVQVDVDQGLLTNLAEVSGFDQSANWVVAFDALVIPGDV